MSFGIFFQNVCTELTRFHNWQEHSNALLYSQGAPALLNIIHKSYENKLTVKQTAILVNKQHTIIFCNKNEQYSLVT